MYDSGIDDALKIIKSRLEYYKKEDSLINDMIIKELESLVEMIQDQKYYK